MIGYLENVKTHTHTSYRNQYNFVVVVYVHEWSFFEWSCV